MTHIHELCTEIHRLWSPFFLTFICKVKSSSRKTWIVKAANLWGFLGRWSLGSSSLCLGKMLGNVLNHSFLFSVPCLRTLGITSPVTQGSVCPPASKAALMREASDGCFEDPPHQGRLFRWFELGVCQIPGLGCVSPPHLWIVCDANVPFLERRLRGLQGECHRVV